MTKADLVAAIASKAELTKTAAEQTLNAILEVMQESLAKEGKLALTSFGSLVVENRKERKGRNPRTGAEITIPAAKVVKFRPGKALKEAIK